MVSVSHPQEGERKRNGQKPGILILNTDYELNHLLESNFAGKDYRVKILSSPAELDEQLMADNDVFLLCGLGERYTVNEGTMLMNKLCLVKENRNEPYMTVVPSEQQDKGYFKVLGNELQTDARPFDESMRIIRRVFEFSRCMKYRLPIDFAKYIAESIDDVVRGDESRQTASVEMLLSQVREHPGNPELYIALGQAFEARNQPLDAIENYRKALRLKPDDADAFHAIGELLLNRKVAQKLIKLDPSLIRLIEASQDASSEVDHYKNALYLAQGTQGDVESLQKVIAVCQRHQASPQFSYFYPAMIDAATQLAFKLRQPEDQERLFDLIERFVGTMQDADYTIDGENIVGMRIVKRHTGRHTVFDIVPTSSQGVFQSQYVFVKAFTPRQQKSAEIEFTNIETLRRKHGEKIVTPYETVWFPPFAVLAQKPDDERKPVYLVTPLLEGVRADRFLEKITDADTKKRYLLRIMDAGIALQVALKDAGRVAEPEADFYIKRFDEKGIARLEELGILKLTARERTAALAFFNGEIHHPLMDVHAKLKAPYTGSHTLKNLLIDPPSGPVLPEQEVALSRITRCDLEDICNRFFASDHVLAIEDDAVGLTDEGILRELYDRLLSRMLTATHKDQSTDVVAIDGSPTRIRKEAARLLREARIGIKPEAYHDLIARTSLERHLTYAFDRIKEIDQKKDHVRRLEAQYKRLAAFGTWLRNAHTLSGESPFNYDAVFEKLLRRRDEYPDKMWKQFYLFFAVHQDYEAFLRSKQHHLGWVDERMGALWGRNTRSLGYRAFRKIIDAAAAYH